MNFKYVVFFFALSSSVYAADFKLISNVKTFEVNNILNEVTSELPKSMKESIGKTVTVEFKNLNSTEVNRIDEKCSDHIILGLDSTLPGNSTIQVENVFVNEIRKGNRSINCAHKDIKTYLKSTIVHELAHMYDHERNVSKNTLFLNIGGWVTKGIVVKKRTNMNQRDERSPDRYEFKSAAETFAVNFEFFLYDPEFKCRRQTYYEFYANEFKSTPNTNGNCEAIKKIMVTSETTNMTKEDLLVRSMDFDRLYQVHYLFAGKGNEVMSRFGHSMYRLVFCAPGKPKGPSCLNDTSYHIVVSFRANVQEMTTDYSKGMNGEYPSQLFFLSLPEVVDEYTKGEFREITSLPLKLTDTQAKRFLIRSSELYWGYKGKYYFFTNNCATEALNLLKVARNEPDALQDKDITTPIGLYKYLIKIGLGDISVLNDIKDAQQKGYYFPGITSKVLASLKVLGIKETDFAKFIKNNNADKRMAIYKFNIDRAANKVMIAANALRLEDLILHSEEMKFAKKVGSMLFGNEADEKLKAALGNRLVELQKMQQELSPEHFLAPGYGVPLVGEFDSIPQDKINDVGEKSKEYGEEMQSIIREYYPAELQELQISSANRGKLLKTIATSSVK
ncbi:MAG: DUF4105 domain-containing protein [Rhizobacter sp.]|nr:DUF4105 domain-containing protein [Bacteriovorax sp.]